MTKTVDEIIQNVKEPKWVIERFFWVVDKITNDTIPFLFNAVQKKYYAKRSRWDLILKARKEGFSTLIIAIWLVSCLFIKNTRAVVVSHEDDATKRLFAKVKFFLNTMGAAGFKFTVQVDQDSQKQITFPGTNSSFWLGTAGSRSFGRGDDITHLLLTEIAHYKNQDFIIGVLNACTPTAWRVLETTANGIGEVFHKLWEEAGDLMSGSQWKQHFFAWFEDQAYRMAAPQGFRLTPPEERMKAKIIEQMGVEIDNDQIYWYRRTYASSPDKEKFVQEYPSYPEEAFVASGRHVFPIDKLIARQKRCPEPLWVGELEDNGADIELLESQEGGLRIWKKPREGRKYIIPGDVAEGLRSGAYSVGTVLDRASWEVVAEWRGHIDPWQFGVLLAVLGEYYNWALLAPEMNNHGHTTVEAIKQKNYPHILKTTDLWPESTEKMGFPTDVNTKEKCISALRNAWDEESYIENSKVAITEMMRAVRDEHGKMVSQSGFLDTVITRGIGLYALKFLTLDETYRESDEDYGAGTSGRQIVRRRNFGRVAA